MLINLLVKNYALIRELDIYPGDGLTIITGETGAGKTILLGALSLILGSRADTTVLLNKKEKCIVEGTFRIEEYDLEEFFSINDLDYQAVTILRREINTAGKSRAFINDTPVTINLLKELGSKLIDIHSQHQALMLNDNFFQLSVIDSFAGTTELREEYRVIFSGYVKLKREYDSAREKADRNKADLEYYRFQLDQLEEAGLKQGEQEELEVEQELLVHAEEIKNALNESSALLSADEGSVLAALREVRSNLGKIRTYLPEGEVLYSRIETTLIELDDLATEITRKADAVEADPGRLDQVNSRLDTIFTLIQKHRAKNVDELLTRREEMKELIESIVTGDERLAELEKVIAERESSLKKISGEVSEKRKSVLKETERKIASLLHQLGMPHARFVISLSQQDKLTPTGIDRADFLFTANKQVRPENLSRIASGGELSRVMLSLKSMLTMNNNLPTIIFDEIDSGVSGEVADKVGQILSSMGRNMQVVNITHLPQVASRGTTHYHVFKEDKSDSTITRVKLLSKEERIVEVARLLSGSEITDTALQNARELIKAGTG